jgi:hypothetical protein
VQEIVFQDSSKGDVGVGGIWGDYVSCRSHVGGLFGRISTDEISAVISDISPNYYFSGDRREARRVN